jgi:hypothetical protein
LFTTRVIGAFPIKQVVAIFIATWTLMLPDARLVTIEDAAHAPWIEAPEKMFGAVRMFLGGRWPERSEKVASLEELHCGMRG